MSDLDGELSPLAQALVVRDIAGHGGERDINGAGLAVLLANISMGDHQGHPAALSETQVRERIMGYDVADMPPPADLVGLLAETLSQRLGGIGTGRAWQSIGIKPDAGRGYSSGRSKTIWPIWKTLRDAALETR